jgi:hypothetical protein
MLKIEDEWTLLEKHVTLRRMFNAVQTEWVI